VVKLVAAEGHCAHGLSNFQGENQSRPSWNSRHFACQILALNL